MVLIVLVADVVFNGQGPFVRRSFPGYRRESCKDHGSAVVVGVVAGVDGVSLSYDDLDSVRVIRL